MQGSDLKEKSAKRNMFKEPLNFLKNLYGKKSDKAPAPSVQETPESSGGIQKDNVFHRKNPSDALSIEPTFGRQITNASTSTNSKQIEQEPQFIKLSSGAVVDNVHQQRPYYQLPPFTDSMDSPSRAPPPPSFWRNSSNEGYGHRSSDYGSSPQGHRRGPSSQDDDSASYDTLLREASTLREDLETELNRHRGTKEELENKKAQTKQRIATLNSQHRFDHTYDDVITMLSQELTELEKKVREIEARMTPLDNTINDIKSVEQFIKDREMDSQQASMLFENILKTMFDNYSLSGHVLTGEATHNFGMNRNLLDELQDKMLQSALKRSDPTRTGLEGEQGLDWMEFGDEEERISKISTSESHEEALRKKRRELAREKFQRVSRKLDQVVEFSQKRTKTQFQRAAAFRFNAVDRADAFKDVNYFAAPEMIIPEEQEDSIAMKSTASSKSTMEALQTLDESVWLGLDANQLGESPGPDHTDVSLPITQTTNNAGNQSLDSGANLKISVSGEDPRSSPGTGVGTGPTGSQKQALAPPGGGETGGMEFNIALNFGQGVGPMPDGTGAKSNETGLGQVQLGGGTKNVTPTIDAVGETTMKKSETSSTSGVSTDMNVSTENKGGSDVGKLDINITGAIGPQEDEKKEVKSEIKVDVPKPPPKAKAPPPPPRKGAPPPPPGKKKPGPKGGPPPPPSGKKKANDGLTRAPEVIAMFQEMRKALLGNAAKGGGGPKKIGGGAAADPGALMDELSKNSKYAAQVAADIENYGGIIEGLIKEVSTFEPSDMPEMIEFVNKVDGVLSELSDETAVLKKFDWPQRYYTMLEAKGLYKELEKMKETFSPWKKTENKAVAEMQKIQKFMDKSKTRVDVIMRTKDADEKKFRDNKIPWNAKIFTEVKIASLSPLVAYMEVALEEVKLLMSSAPLEASPLRKKALDKSLEHLRGAVNFSFRVHQFAGGFTTACSTKFAEVSEKTKEIRNEIEQMAS
eukprot:g3332.t1